MQGESYPYHEEQVDKLLGQAHVLLLEARGKDIYVLCSEVSMLDYLTEAPQNCATDNANMQAIEEATRIIRGHDAIEEFLACGIWSLSDS
jgi:hypothetical protein